MVALLSVPALAHNVSSSNANFLASVDGPAIPLFVYLGAKHMVTGIDHVLYLLAVVFLLYQPRQLILVVTLFAAGHSLTLILGVLFGWQINPSAVDAVIGLSVAYKAFENLSGFTLLFGRAPNMHVAVFGFGLVHGLGLATKLQAVYAGGEGLVLNLVAFNAGVELGQLLALGLLLGVLLLWRGRVSFERWAWGCNVVLLACGFAFACFHLLDFSLGTPGAVS